MKKMNQLVRDLLSSGLFDENQMDSYVESMDAVPAIENTGDGLLTCRVTYDCEIDIQDFESANNEELVLMSIVSLWLVENDENRFDEQLPEPRFHVDATEGSLADVSINIRFYENVGVVENTEGRICFKGQRYDIGEPLECTIEEAEVYRR